MRYFIVSQPKAGTYLLANLLVEFGLTHSHMHVSPRKYEKYDPNNFDDAVRDPAGYSHQSALSDTLQLLTENSFAVGHLQHNDANLWFLRNFKKILITRDIGDIRQSALRFEQDHKRAADTSWQHLAGIANWQMEKDVFHVTFEEIVHAQKSRIDALQKFIHGEIRFSSIDCVRQAMRKNSLTKSNLRKQLTREAESLPA